MVTVTLALTLTLGWLDPTPAGQVLAGFATYYAAGRMAQVTANRGLIPDPADYSAWLADQGLLGTVALNRAGDRGRRVWIQGPSGLEGPFLAVDCADRHDYAGRERRGRVVEVDRATAQRWHLRSVELVTVYFRRPTSTWERKAY